MVSILQTRTEQSPLKPVLQTLLAGFAGSITRDRGGNSDG